MKRAVCLAVLLAISASLTGCFVWVRGDCDSKHVKQPPAPMDSTIAEIEAVKMLSSDDARLNILLVIAERPGLSPEARLHLIESAKWLSSDDAREQLLMTLARNVDRPLPPPQHQPMMPQPPLPPPPPVNPQ